MSRLSTVTMFLLCLAVASAGVAAEPATAEQKAVPPELIRFHGHECPGVTIGYLMAREAMKAMPADAQLIAIAENRTCGVDALQWVTGCTAGKANLIFKDHGKQAYTVYSAETKKGVRVVFDGQRIAADIRQDKAAFIKWLLTTDPKVFLIVKPVDVNEPEVARTRESAPCSACGEAVSLTHLRESDGRKMCIPCAEKR